MEWRWREGSQAGRSIGPDEPEYLTKSDKLFDGDPGFAENGAERPHTKGFAVCPCFYSRRQSPSCGDAPHHSPRSRDLRRTACRSSLNIPARPDQYSCPLGYPPSSATPLRARENILRVLFCLYRRLALPRTPVVSGSPVHWIGFPRGAAFLSSPL